MKKVNLETVPSVFWLLMKFVLTPIIFLILFGLNYASAQSNELEKNSLSLGEMHLTMCLYFSDQNQYDSAVWHAESAIAIFKAVKDTTGLIDMYHELSLINLDVGIFDESLANNQLALELAEMQRDTSKIVHHLKDNAIIYHDYKQYERGIEYGTQGYELAKKYTSIKPSELADILNAIAINHQANGEADIALDYHLLAHEAFQNSGMKMDYQDSIRLARVQNSIGDTYFHLQNLDSASIWLLLANDLNEKLQNDFEWAENLTNLGRLFTKKKEIQKAIAYLEQATIRAKRSGSVEKTMAVLSAMSDYHSQINQPRQALNFQSQYIILQDSVSQLKQNRAFAIVDARYQISKKQQQIELQEAEINAQQNRLQINILIIIGLILILVLLAMVFLFWRYNLRQKQNLELQKQKQDLLNQQTRAVINSLEKERQRIARDLHDSLGQSVSALGLSIYGLQDKNRPDGQAYENSKTLLNSIHDEIREIAFTLMPQKLMKAGLVGALEELTHRLNESQSIEVTLESFDVPESLDENLVLSLFRIIQEILSNIVKYAKASRVQIQLTGYPTELVVLIEDDGQGFDLDYFKHHGSNGWNNISYRLQLIRGEINFDTVPGRKGTTVTLEIPCS